MSGPRQAPAPDAGPGELTLRINAGESDAAFLAGIETSFPDYGGAAMVRWVGGRTFPGAASPDRITVWSAKGEIMAGSTVVYRQLVLGDGRRIPAALMAGSFALPQVRRQGLFGRIVQASVAAAKAKQASVVLAFVTEARPTFRGILRAGASSRRASYFVARVGGGAAPAGPTLTRRSWEAFEADDWLRGKCGRLHFDYAPGDWKSQFVDKPYPIYTLATEDGSTALVEEHPTTLRISASRWRTPRAFETLLDALRVHAASTGREVFGYSTRAATSAAYERCGFEQIPGRIMALDVDLAAAGAGIGIFDEAGDGEGWDLESGDRM